MRRVSVVIPAYNAAAWIGEALQSVLMQQGAELEVIVVDDGSADETATIAASYPGVRCIRQQNAGQAAARNAGIRAARGEFIAFLDADDVWLPGKVQAQLDVLQSRGLVWAYSDSLFFDARDGRDLRTFGEFARQQEGDILVPLFLGNFIGTPNVIAHHTVFAQVGLFDESPLLRQREDWDMWLRIAAQYPVGLVRRPLARIRFHAGSSTGREGVVRSFVSQLAVIERAVARSPQLQAYKGQAVARVCFRTGLWLLSQQQVGMAARMLWRAVQQSPREVAAQVGWLVCPTGRCRVQDARRLWGWLGYLRSR
jgi:hypothetical protein